MSRTAPRSSGPPGTGRCPWRGPRRAPHLRAIADEVARRRDEDRQKFRAIAEALKVSEGTVTRAYDWAHREDLVAAVAEGHAPPPGAGSPTSAPRATARSFGCSSRPPPGRDRGRGRLQQTDRLSGPAVLEGSPLREASDVPADRRGGGTAEGRGTRVVRQDRRGPRRQQGRRWCGAYDFLGMSRGPGAEVRDAVRGRRVALGLGVDEASRDRPAARGRPGPGGDRGRSAAVSPPSTATGGPEGRPRRREGRQQHRRERLSK